MAVSISGQQMHIQKKRNIWGLCNLHKNSIFIKKKRNMLQKELEQNIREFASDHNVSVEQCRVIPKNELITGITYKGNCRNADEAIWDVDKFLHIRYKFGSEYPETINHFEDDDGYDVFVPIEIMKDKKQN